MCIFLNENVCIAIKLRCVYNGRRCPGDKPFSGTMMVSLLTYMFIIKLTLISVCISNHMCNIVWYEITWLISMLCNVCNYLPMLGQKLINATKKEQMAKHLLATCHCQAQLLQGLGFVYIINITHKYAQNLNEPRFPSVEWEHLLMYLIFFKLS